MAYRKRRRRSAASSIVGDTAYIANRLSWKGALIFGAVLWVLFYWVIPAWIHYELQHMNGSTLMRPMLDAYIGRRVHWFQWIGVALALVCVFFAAWNYFTLRRLDRRSETDVGWLGRVFARWME